MQTETGMMTVWLQRMNIFLRFKRDIKFHGAEGYADLIAECKSQQSTPNLDHLIKNSQDNSNLSGLGWLAFRSIKGVTQDTGDMTKSDICSALDDANKQLASLPKTPDQQAQNTIRTSVRGNR